MCLVCLRSFFLGLGTQAEAVLVFAFAIEPIYFFAPVHHCQHARNNTENTHAKSNNWLPSLSKSNDGRRAANSRSNGRAGVIVKLPHRVNFTKLLPRRYRGKLRLMRHKLHLSKALPLIVFRKQIRSTLNR